MSILIQFVQDNAALFISAIIALVVLVGAIVALVIVKRKLKKAELASGINQKSKQTQVAQEQNKALAKSKSAAKGKTKK